MSACSRLRRALYTLSRLAAGVALFGAVCLGAVDAVSAAEEIEQPALSALVAPRSDELRTAGIQSIVARTGKHRRDIQVITQYGTAYFGWPKKTTPVVFEIYAPRTGPVLVFTSDYSESLKPRYAAAFDALIPEAVRQAQLTRATAQRPKH